MLIFESERKQIESHTLENGATAARAHLRQMRARDVLTQFQSPSGRWHEFTITLVPDMDLAAAVRDGMKTAIPIS